MLMVLFFGLMYMLASYATFSLSNMITFKQLNTLEITETFPGVICSFIGLFIGYIIRKTAKIKEF